MLQEGGFPSELTVAETARMWADCTSGARPQAEALEPVGLADKHRVRVKQLSGGERRRLDLALALLGDPEVLFLDEPTTGLDAEGRRDTWQLVRALRDAGTTVLLTTHYLEEAEGLADRLAILHEGRIAASGTPAEVTAGRPARMSFELPAGYFLGDLPSLAELGVCGHESDGHVVRLRTTHLQRTATGVLVFLRRSAALVVLIAAAFATVRPSGLGVLATGAFVAFAAGFSLLATRCGAWTLSVLWEAERAREIEARLAVAEERLRFGRDLHDVLGRNLSVISLKSELAVQLARRGRPEAVEQMIEVQRIAQESQREVRAVVRGYREADLGAELAGARGVLTAAGIECEVRAETAGLPAQVQSALGWVVREATTNVLRHGDASRCAVGLGMLEGHVVLTVENDGVTGPGGTAAAGRAAGVDGDGPGDGGSGGGPGGSGYGPCGSGGGSGLAGLRERLAAVDGSLEAGAVGEGRFRVVARVPLGDGEEPLAGKKVRGVTS
jgi:signal transduction histidine kinase